MPATPTSTRNCWWPRARRDLPTLSGLLEKGAAPNSRNRLGKTEPADRRREGADCAMVERLLGVRAPDVQQASLEGVTPLIGRGLLRQAAGGASPACRGRHTEPVDRMDRSAMVYAAALGHAEVVQALLAHGIAVDAPYPHRLTALMWAAGQGQGEIVKLLLASGARAELRDDRGLTAAQIAREAGHAPVAALIEAKS